ncbi:MAG TPA: hypothetical protein VJ783_10725 [Pirellulales bacterium]|nr:hypothetical protein [Pirellulales bacterium]
MLLERRQLLLGFVTVALIAGACQADELRSDAADREAAVLALVVALDHTMLLSDQQREDFQRLLSKGRPGEWRAPQTWRAFIKPRPTPWETAMVRAAFVALAMQDSELAPILRPAQLRACGELRVFALTLRNQNKPAPRAIELLFELSLDDVTAACELTEAERARFRLAGASDIHHLDRAADQTKRQARANEQDVAAPVLPGPSLAAGTLPDDLTRYRKALEQWLTAEQRQKLDAAHQRRRQFERRAELAGVLRVIRSYCRPNDMQCERLSEYIAGQLGDPSTDNGEVCVRAQLLGALSRLPAREIADIVGGDRGNFALLWKELRSQVQKLEIADRITLTQ